MRRRVKRKRKGWGEENAALEWPLCSELLLSLFSISLFPYFLSCVRRLYHVYVSPTFVRSFVYWYLALLFCFDVFLVRDVIIVILIYIGLRSEMGSQTINIYRHFQITKLMNSSLIFQQYVCYKRLRWSRGSVLGSNPAEAVGFLRAKKSSARLPSEGK